MDVISQTLEYTTQLAINIEIGLENREIKCQYHVSHFPMLKNHRQNSTLHSNKFFSSIYTL